MKMKFKDAKDMKKILKTWRYYWDTKILGLGHEDNKVGNMKLEVKSTRPKIKDMKTWSWEGQDMKFGTLGPSL
jgi:hypothetical protein